MKLILEKDWNDLGCDNCPFDEVITKDDCQMHCKVREEIQLTNDEIKRVVKFINEELQ